MSDPIGHVSGELPPVVIELVIGGELIQLLAPELDYQALAILFDGQTIGHEVRLEFEDAEPIIIPPSNSFDLTISIDLGQGVVVKNPDRLVSRRELSEMMAAVLRGP